MNAKTLLATLGVDLAAYEGDALAAHSPINGATLATLRCDSRQMVANKIAGAQHAFMIWRNIPAPKRGELVRLLGEELRANKDALGQLVTIESGKILQEGERAFGLKPKLLSAPP